MSILLAPTVSGANLERFDAADVKAATDLTELFETVTTGRWGKYSCPHPDHDDNRPSLSVFTGNDGGQGFRCHGCGWAGDALTFVQDVHRLDFPEAVKWLADWANVSPSTDDYRPRRPRPAPKPTAPKVRTLEPLEAEGDRLADQGEWLEIFAEERSLHPETLEALGVYAVRRSGRPRLRFPFRLGNGQTVSAQDRRLVDDDGRDKWLTAPGGTALFYNLLAFDHAAQWA
ncbi:MAG: CHC2 zinc finger domain-containing protein, partial [Acidimicrobiales bacterium]